MFIVHIAGLQILKLEGVMIESIESKGAAAGSGLSALNPGIPPPLLHRARPVHAQLSFKVTDCRSLHNNCAPGAGA